MVDYHINECRALISDRTVLELEVIYTTQRLKELKAELKAIDRKIKSLKELDVSVSFTPELQSFQNEPVAHTTASLLRV